MTGRRVLVTGAARGIGRAIAVHLGDLGYRVAVLDANFLSFREFNDEGSTVADELSAAGVPVLFAETRTTDVAAMECFVERIVQEWGGLDAVVCNAGGGSGRFDENRASQIDLEMLNDVFQRNLVGTITTIQTSLAALRNGAHPAIVTMGSATGVLVSPTGSYAHYGLTKAAIMHYTRYLAQDLAAEGIRVNCVAPGIIATGRAKLRLGEDPSRALLTPVGDPADVAAAVAYFIAPGSAYVSGQQLNLWGPETTTPESRGRDHA